MNLHTGSSMLVAVCLSAVLHLIIVSSPVYGADPAWSYDDSAPNGPSKWSTLPGYESCGGRSQSPINIVTRSAIRMYTKLKFFNYNSYNARTLTVQNDGHSVNLDLVYASDSLADAAYITGALLDGKYKLINVHFHWGSKSTIGSEHTLNGYRYPMEVHFVHIKSTYKTLEIARTYADGVSVIGSMYRITNSDNSYMSGLLSSIKLVTFKNDSIPVNPVNLYNLLPANYDNVYAYKGSLTTPPCSESVAWNMFEAQAEISENQMKIFRGLQKETKANNPNKNMPLVDNFRAIQDLNGRKVHWEPQY